MRLRKVTIVFPFRLKFRQCAVHPTFQISERIIVVGGARMEWPIQMLYLPSLVEPTLVPVWKSCERKWCLSLCHLGVWLLCAFDIDIWYIRVAFWSTHQHHYYSVATGFDQIAGICDLATPAAETCCPGDSSGTGYVCQFCTAGLENPDLIIPDADNASCADILGL